jgi:fructokinase
MGKILCTGELLIDMICTDKGATLSAGENFLKKPGGAPANVAVAIAALGGQADIAAKVGKDPFGRCLKEVMEDFGVSTRYLFRDDQYFTTFAFVSLMLNGERDFYFNRGADAQLNDDDIAAINPTEYSIVHFGSATAFLPGPLQTAYANLHQKCFQQGLFVSFDPNYRHLLFKDNMELFRQKAWAFLQHCHFFKVSDEEAMLLTGAFSVNDAATILLKKTSATFAITIGKDGTLLGLNGEIFTVPSIEIKATDTTGAGDAFVGAVLYQLSGMTKTEINELPKEKWGHIIYNANKAGARTCEHIGAMEAFKHLSSDIFK